MSVAMQPRHGIAISVRLPFTEAVERVRHAFAAQGFGVLQQIDVQSTLKERFGEEIEPYVLLGLCDPGTAPRSIHAEREAGRGVPWYVVVHACPDEVEVAVQRPLALNESALDAEPAPTAEDVLLRVGRALRALGRRPAAPPPWPGDMWDGEGQCLPDGAAEAPHAVVR